MAMDPLVSYTFCLEIDGIQAAFFSEGAGFDSEVAVIEHRENGAGGKEIIRKLPGQKKWSDITLKHDIVLLGHLPNGLGYYRFSYNGSDRPYVGVMAQEVQTVMPKAVVRDRDGTLRVLYDRLGVRFQTYEHWIASGARVPMTARMH